MDDPALLFGMLCGGEGRGRAKKGTIQRKVKKEKAGRIGNIGVARISAAGCTHICIFNPPSR